MYILISGGLWYSVCVCFLRFLALTGAQMLPTSICQAWKTLTTVPFPPQKQVWFDLQLLLIKKVSLISPPSL